MEKQPPSKRRLPRLSFLLPDPPDDSDSSLCLGRALASQVMSTQCAPGHLRPWVGARPWPHLRHRPRTTPCREARARAAKPGEPANPRAAATGPVGRRIGGLQLLAEDRAARTSLRACRTGVRVSVPRRHLVGSTWSGALARPTASREGLQSLDSSRAAWRSGAAPRSAATPLPWARAWALGQWPVGFSGPPTRMSRAFPKITM